jgi:hypothetical protein
MGYFRVLNEHEMNGGLPRSVKLAAKVSRRSYRLETMLPRLLFNSFGEDAPVRGDGILFNVYASCCAQAAVISAALPRLPGIVNVSRVPDRSGSEWARGR